MKLFHLIIVAIIAGSAACVAAPPTAPPHCGPDCDAGSSADVAAPRDGGTPDAGEPSDASDSPDVSRRPDAGEPPDTGSAPDADEPCGGCPIADTVCDAVTEQCVQCVEHGHCSGSPDGEFCDSGTRKCTECLATDDCQNPTASVCRNGTCEGCASDADCQHVPDANVCDAGVCVQCTASKASSCAGRICNSFTRTCSPHVSDSAGSCEECVSDAHCSGSYRCVMLFFTDTTNGNQNIDIGPACVPPSAVGCDPGLSTLRLATSVDSSLSQYFCVPDPLRSSCQAILDARAETVCMSADGCGVEAIADAACPDTTQDVDVCVLRCDEDQDCLDNSRCGGGVCR